MLLLALALALSLSVGVPSPSDVPAVDFVSLPGGPPVGMDYLAYDPKNSRLWVPAGNTGRIDVLDTQSHRLEVILPVPVSQRGERMVGASAATVGASMVYVGNRADLSICAFDARTLARRGCVVLPSSPDGLAYVATTQEVWVTTPGDQTVVVLDVKEPGAPRIATSVRLTGRPEGYAVDASRGIFYTNLEDKDRTVAVDVSRKEVLSTFEPGCGEGGPRGLALEERGRLLFVACTNRLKALNATDGTVISQLLTGDGVDNIDYLPALRLVYAASGKAGQLTVARVSERGELTVASTRRTPEGCRTVVVDSTGTAYLPDSRGGRLVVVHPAG